MEVDKAEARSEESRRSAEIKVNIAKREMDNLIDQKYTVQANVSAFMMHSAYIEMCGMLCNEELSRPEFDALLQKGLTAAVGERSNTDPKLGTQAGAALKLSLDRIQGLAVLRKRPMAVYERGGYWGGKEIPPHPSYALLKRAKLTPEFDPPK